MLETFDKYLNMLDQLNYAKSVVSRIDVHSNHAKLVRKMPDYGQNYAKKHNCLLFFFATWSANFEPCNCLKVEVQAICWSY